MNATHEGITLYWHYFNNDLECPNGENNCAFAHKDSEDCKYGKLCERLLCMFKHETGEENKKDESIEKDIDTLHKNTEENEYVIQNIEEIEDLDEDEVIDQPMDTTFRNPSVRRNLKN